MKFINWFKKKVKLWKAILENPYYPYEYAGGAFPDYYSVNFTHDKDYRSGEDHFWFCTCNDTGKKYYCVKRNWYYGVGF